MVIEEQINNSSFIKRSKYALHISSLDVLQCAWVATKGDLCCNSCNNLRKVCCQTYSKPHSHCGYTQFILYACIYACMYVCMYVMKYRW